MGSMRTIMSHVLPMYPDAVFVQWDVLEPDPVRGDGLTFRLERSGSPNGEWTSVAENLSTVFHKDTFEDVSEEEEYNLFSLRREIWYRVVAVTTDGDQITSRPMNTFGDAEPDIDIVRPIGATVHPDTEQSYPAPDTLFHPTPRLRRRLQLAQHAVTRRAITALRTYTGVHLAVLKKRHFGRRCPDCYDVNTKQVLFSRCDTCYGTGWEGGFYPPFTTLGRVIEQATQTQIESEGETEIIRAQIDTINFPRLHQHDVLVELDSNRRWEVNRLDRPTLRRQQVLQFTLCTELARTSAVYRVDVDDTTPLEINNATIEPTDPTP